MGEHEKMIVFDRGFKRVGDAAKKAGLSGSKAAKFLSRDMALASKGAAKLAGALGGVAVAAGAKKILDFNSALGQLQADSGMSTLQISAMRDEMLASSTAFGLSKDEVVKAAMVFQDFGGVLKEGRPLLNDLSKVSVATGTSMESLAKITATFIDTMKLSPDDAIKGIAMLVDQSKAGKINIKKLADVLPEVLSGGQLQGFEGLRAVQQLGTAMQVIGGASRGPEQANTALAALFRDLIAKREMLKKDFKINIFENYFISKC